MGEKYMAISCYSINFHNGTTAHTTVEMKEVCPFSHSDPHCPFMAVHQHINELNTEGVNQCVTLYTCQGCLQDTIFTVFEDSLCY